MSITLLRYAERFLQFRMSAEVFSKTYMELWKIERDERLLEQDAAALSFCLSCMFTASDAFVPQKDRLDCELDENQFRKEITEHIVNFEAGITGSS